MIYELQTIRNDIARFLPEGLVVPRHTEDKHFYEVNSALEARLGRTRYNGSPDPVYPSVTGKLQILKDESLINFKMNRAIEAMSNYIFANHGIFTNENIMEHIGKAKELAIQAPASIVTDAGDVGTRIHDIRHNYFKEWIATGKKPEKNILEYIPAHDPDIRVVSALRALESFINDSNYEPVACELLIYDHKLAVAGTLDDLGMMDCEMRPGDKNCVHATITTFDGYITRCLKCNRKTKRQFVLMDLKTSNQFKDHYFFQVALYYHMIQKLTRYKPERCFILKVSKTDGRYKIEDLYYPARLAVYARSMVRTHEGISKIKELRSDNQKVVIKI